MIKIKLVINVRTTVSTFIKKTTCRWVKIIYYNFHFKWRFNFNIKKRDPHLTSFSHQDDLAKSGKFYFNLLICLTFLNLVHYFFIYHTILLFIMLEPRLSDTKINNIYNQHLFVSIKKIWYPSFLFHLNCFWINCLINLYRNNFFKQKICY